MWMNEFNSSREALAYAINNSTDNIDFIEYATLTANDGNILGYITLKNKWEVPLEVSGISREKMDKHKQEAKERFKREQEHYAELNRLEKEQQKAEEERKKSDAIKYQEQAKAEQEKFRGLSDAEIDQMIQKNPSSLLKMPEDMRTLDRWVKAASLYPFIITCIHDKNLRSKVQHELNESGEGELQRIKKLSK
jgi:hypothetical protein